MENRHECHPKVHLHEIQGSVRIFNNGCEAHNHRFATVSCEPIEGSGGDHVHKVIFRTDSYEGHFHEFCGETTGAHKLCDGHVHCLKGMTTECAGHRHCFKVVTHIEDPIGD